MLRGDPRVCEVAALAAATDTEGELGSGFIVDGVRRVVTARHVVTPDAFVATAWRVRPLGTSEWLPARLVYEARVVDVAVVELVDAVGLPAGFGPVGLGRLGGTDRVEGRGVGFPESRRARQMRGLPISDPEDLRGELRPATSAKGDGIALHVAGSAPAEVAVGSAWAGMSGAGIRVGPWLVGVVESDPARFGTDRLKVALFGDEPAEYQPALLAALGGGRWEVADRPAGLLPPYQTPPATLRGSARSLRAAYGLVPFVGRDVEIDDLTGWCASQEHAAVRLVTGSGGKGKTRLVAEVALIMAERGWLTGFLKPDAETDQIVDIETRGGPKLVIVDYADTRIEQVRRLLDAATSSPEAIRILLVARTADRWWTTLPGKTDSDLVGNPADVIALNDAPLTTEQRTVAYRAARGALSAHFGVSDSPPGDPDLSDDTFDGLLFIHLLALTHVDPAVGTQTPPSGEVSAERSVAARLLDQALDREDQKFWVPTVQGVAELTDDTTRRRVVAAATLTAAPDEDHAVEVLQAIPGLSVVSAVRPAHWYHNFHETDTDAPYLPPLEPDRLGEHLVHQILQGRPSFALDLTPVTPQRPRPSCCSCCSAGRRGTPRCAPPSTSCSYNITGRSSIWRFRIVTSISGNSSPQPSTNSTTPRSARPYLPRYPTPVCHSSISASPPPKRPSSPANRANGHDSSTTCRECCRTSGGMRRRWRRSPRPSPTTGGWPSKARMPSPPTSPRR
jgi:hypothetical protein